MKCHEACAQPKTLNYKGKSLQGSILESIFGGILLVALVLKKKQTNFAFGWIKNSFEKIIIILIIIIINKRINMIFKSETVVTA